MATSKTKRIDVNSSSIVDLKAELFRKQEEVRLKKNDTFLENTVEQSPCTDQFVAETSDDHLYEKGSHNISRLPKKFTALPLDDKKTFKRDKKININPESSNETTLTREEELALEKSRTMLEKKAKLYDQMASGSVFVEDDNEDILVNFGKKIADNGTGASTDEDQDEDEELVEYEDEFGRTRLVKKKDLPSTETSTDERMDPSAEWTLENHLLSEDMKREIERREWEESTRRDMKNNKQKVHYEDVREGEIRNHGIAFFNFSVNEDVRTQQMEMLEQMRQETESKKSEKQRIKEKRKQMLKARLSKVAARKGIAMAEEESEQSDSEPEERIVIEKARLKTEENPVKVTRLRDWDIGKEGLYASKSSATQLGSGKAPVYSQEKYIENRRMERNATFAPPSIYSESRATPTYGQSKRFKPEPRNLDEGSGYRRNEAHSGPDAHIASLVGDQLSQIRRNLSQNNSQ